MTTVIDFSFGFILGLILERKLKFTYKMQKLWARYKAKVDAINKKKRDLIEEARNASTNSQSESPKQE